MSRKGLVLILALVFLLWGLISYDFQGYSTDKEDSGDFNGGALLTVSPGDVVIFSLDSSEEMDIQIIKYNRQSIDESDLDANLWVNESGVKSFTKMFVGLSGTATSGQFSFFSGEEGTTYEIDWGPTEFVLDPADATFDYSITHLQPLNKLTFFGLVLLSQVLLFSMLSGDSSSSYSGGSQGSPYGGFGGAPAQGHAAYGGAASAPAPYAGGGGGFPPQGGGGFPPQGGGGGFGGGGYDQGGGGGWGGA